MATLLLRLVGPMQSWGTASRFNQRDTGSEPSKSGVIGLLAAACGIDRGNWTDLEPLTHLIMAVRHDRPGLPKCDYQTGGCAKHDTVIQADGSKSKNGVVSFCHYLADAAFLVGVETSDSDILMRIYYALQDPVWPLFLGRKSYLPSEPLWLPNKLNPIQDASLCQVMARQPWLGSRRLHDQTPTKLLLSRESLDGSGAMHMDQPISSFAERRFGARFVLSEWITFPGEVADVSA